MATKTYDLSVTKKTDTEASVFVLYKIDKS